MVLKCTIFSVFGLLFDLQANLKKSARQKLFFHILSNNCRAKILLVDPSSRKKCPRPLFYTQSGFHMRHHSEFFFHNFLARVFFYNVGYFDFKYLTYISSKMQHLPKPKFQSKRDCHTLKSKLKSQFFRKFSNFSFEHFGTGLRPPMNSY